MHNTGFRLEAYLNTLNKILEGERESMITADFTAEQHNGMTLYSNTVEANAQLANALSVFSKSNIYGKTNMTQDQIKHHIVKAFRCLGCCYVVIFSGEAIDLEVIEARLKWSEAFDKAAVVQEDNLAGNTEWFVESIQYVVELLKDLCVNSYQRSNLVTSMVALSNLVRHQGYILSELCSDDKEYLYKISPYKLN